MECDSHADTTCAGRNCVVLSYTNQVIDVFGFHDSLGALKSVPIASVATLATDSKGKEVILVLHEALYFGDKMQHTLLSVNQARAYDVSVWDNPCDPNHPLSIEASDTTVNMQVEGIVVFVDTRSPTKAELKDLPHVELTSDCTWNPLSATYQLHPLGVEYLDEGRKIEVVREDSIIQSSPSLFPALTQSDWLPPNFDSSSASSFHPSFGISDFAIGAVSTAFSPSLYDAVKDLDPSDRDFTSFLRTGGFRVECDTRKGKTVTWANEKLSQKEDVPLDEQLSRIEFRASQFPKDRHS